MLLQVNRDLRVKLQACMEQREQAQANTAKMKAMLETLLVSPSVIASDLHPP